MRAFRLAMYLDDGLVCGGAERVARRLLNHWSEQGYDVYMVARQPPDTGFYDLPPGVSGLSLSGQAKGQNGTKPGTDKSAGIRSRWLRFVPGRAFIRLIYEAFLLRRVLSRIDADVTVAFLTPANVKLLISAFGLRCKVVVSERNDTRAYRYPIMWRVLRRLLYRRADMVTANMAGAIQDMAAYVPESRLAFVPNPVELPPDELLARADRSNRIVSVGRLVSYKRHLMLIQAFASLNDEFHAWELDIVGDGPMRPELEKMIAEHGLCGRVHLHGLIRDVDTFYRAGGIFVLPSSVEGTPNALLEAMAHALPCIVSDSISGAHNYIEEGVTGFTFSSRSTLELTRKIEFLAHSPQLRSEIGSNARNKLKVIEPATAYQAWDRVIELVAGSQARSATNP